MSTDIQFGRRHDLKTLLVLTGNGTENEVMTSPKDNLPDYYTDSVADLLCVAAT